MVRYLLRLSTTSTHTHTHTHALPEKSITQKHMGICDILSSDGQWIKSLDIVQYQDEETGDHYLELHDHSPDKRDCREDVECKLLERICDRLLRGIPRSLFVSRKSRHQTTDSSSLEDYTSAMCKNTCRLKAKRKPIKDFENDDTLFIQMSEDEINTERKYIKRRDLSIERTYSEL